MTEPGLELIFDKSRPRPLSPRLNWKGILLNVYLVKTDYCTVKEDISVNVQKTRGPRIQNRSKYH